MTDAPFKITFPIEKAETRDDGLYLIGEASGPEIDAEGERMHEDLVHRFAEQINSTKGLPLEERLPYRDAHAPDGVLRDLGWLTSASITEKDHLRVEVRLDQENPAAVYLHRKIANGKKYGMSVAGTVHDVVHEFAAEVGRAVRTFKDVVLTEISNTTRPAWTPSFGSVLSKALDDATQADSTQGASHVSEKDSTQQEQTAAGSEDTTKTEEAVVETPVVEETTEEQKSEDTSALTPELNKAIAEAVASAVAAALAAQAPATTPAEDSAEKTDSQDQEANPDATTETHDETTPDAAKALSEANAELTKRVAELEEALKTNVPPVIERIGVSENFKKAMADLTPAERLRVAFAASTDGK